MADKLVLPDIPPKSPGASAPVAGKHAHSAAAPSHAVSGQAAKPAVIRLEDLPTTAPVKEETPVAAQGGDAPTVTYGALAQEAQPHRLSPGARSVLSFIIMLACVLGFVFLMKTFVYQAYTITTGSMEETILPGDMVFAEKLSFHFRDIRPGDIVTFEQEGAGGTERVLIKRVIAVAGQTIDLVDGHVLLDGVQRDEPYVKGVTSPLSPSAVVYPYTVPEGYVWVMGDNRQNSSDSRAFGPIPVSSVLERAVFTYWPVDRVGSLYK